MQFQPSNYGDSNSADYGIWPFDVFSDWAADETQAGLAQFGVAADTTIYDQTPSRMVVAPKTQIEAYDQAIYWLSVARRRADFENEDAAASAMSRAISTLQSEQSAAKFDNIVCTTTGWFCTSKGMGSVLQYAIDAIGTSGLNSEDRDRVVAHLQANAQGAWINQMMPYLALVAVGAAAGSWWYYRRKAAG